jgi:hypothetical protein
MFKSNPFGSNPLFKMSGLRGDNLLVASFTKNGDPIYKNVSELNIGDKVYNIGTKDFNTIKYVVRMRVSRDKISMYDINGVTMTGNSIVKTDVLVYIPDTFFSKGRSEYQKRWALVEDLSNAIPNDEQVDYIYNFVMENSEHYLPLANGMKFATLAHCIQYDGLIDYFFGCRKVVDALESYLNMRKDILGIGIDVIIDLRHNDFVTKYVYNEQYQAYEIHVVLDISNIINTRWLIR